MELVIIIIGLSGMTGLYLYFTMRETQLTRARKAEEKGDLDTALAIFMDSLRKEPNNTDTIWHLGNINEEKKQYPEAIGYYTRLLELKKDSKLYTEFELYRRIGILYRRIGMDREALDNLMEALRLIGTAKDVLENIAMIIHSQKAFARALPYFEKANQFNDNNTSLFFHHALCLCMLNRVTDALNVLDKGRRADPRDPGINFLMAYALTQMETYGSAGEIIEEFINTNSDRISIEQMHYSIKILYLSYLNQRNYEVVKDLVARLRDISLKLNDSRLIEEALMAFIFFRIKQGYYDSAIEEICRNQNVCFNLDNPDTTKKEPVIADNIQNSNPLYRLVTLLNKYKKDREKLSVNAPNMKPNRYEFEMGNLDQNIKETLEKTEKIFNDWKSRFLPREILWEFYGEKAASQFDPAIVLDKYQNDAVKTIKDRVSRMRGSESMVLDSDKEEKEKEFHIDANDPCSTIRSADFPEFQLMVKNLADAMGFRIINQGIKLDKSTYSEGKGVDLLCTEKLNANTRVLFSFRRWNDPIGNIAITDLVGSIRNFQAQRIVLISTTPLSDEARIAIDGRSVIDFYTCEQVANYLL